MSSSAVSGVKLANPFPGLRPFFEEEEHLFFGRESQVDSMLDKLSVSRFLAVVGTSGSGKSSLVNCGLKPALRRGLMTRAGSHWRMAYFRPGGQPIKALARALAEPGVLFDNPDFGGLPLDDIIEATLLMSNLGVVDVYEQSLSESRTNLLLIVDQFEELFRFRAGRSSLSGEPGSDEKATALVNLLLEGVRSKHAIYVVLTMRSDFLGDCARFEGLPEAINRGEYLVPRMTREERRSAIVGPVQVGGGEISPVLVTRLLNDVGDNPDQLSILQHALNRTWSRWQFEGHGIGAMSLEHYEAIGRMAHALDQHAEKAFAELPDERARNICKKIFQALTDKGTDARGVRRPTRLSELCAIAEVSPEDATPIINVFRKPSRSFLMPPSGETLEVDTVIDISHESLMRVWTRLRGWVDEEAESAAQYLRLVENANLHAKGASGLMADPELAVMLEWQERWNPNAAWAKRYHPDFDGAMLFLHGSRIAQDAIRLAEEHRQKQQLRRTQAAAALLGVAFVIAVVLAIFAFQQRTTAHQKSEIATREMGFRMQAQEAERKAERERENADTERKKAEDAENRAKAADALAEKEAEQSKRNAQLFMSAMQAQAKAQRLAEVELEAEALMQQAEPNASPGDLKTARDNVENAKQEYQRAAADAARKTGEAFVIMGAAKAIGTDRISSSDVFDTASGAQVTDAFSAKNPQSMFSGAKGPRFSPTVFPDGESMKTGHPIEFQTKRPTTIQSVALFAAHDSIRYRRAFKWFVLYARKDGRLEQIAEYTPALPYGGNCSKDPCLPPDIRFAPGTVLSVCINVSKPIQAQHYVAEFYQAVSRLEGFSGPRVLQLDGYEKPNCAQ